MNIITLPLSQLKPNPNNPRVITSVMMDKLKKSIQEFPEMLNIRPIILDKDNVILGGNMRFKALQSLGYTEAPCIYADQLTPEEQQDLLIKNNLSYGDWDWDDIITNWQLESVRDWGLDVPGFFFDDDVEPEIEIQDDYNRIKTIVINLDTQHYTKMLDELNGVVRREGLADYSDAILFLINNYEDN